MRRILSPGRRYFRIRYSGTNSSSASGANLAALHPPPLPLSPGVGVTGAILVNALMQTFPVGSSAVKSVQAEPSVLMKLSPGFAAAFSLYPSTKHSIGMG